MTNYVTTVVTEKRYPTVLWWYQFKSAMGYESVPFKDVPEGEFKPAEELYRQGFEPHEAAAYLKGWRAYATQARAVAMGVIG